MGDNSLGLTYEPLIGKCLGNMAYLSYCRSLFGTLYMDEGHYHYQPASNLGIQSRSLLHYINFRGRGLTERVTQQRLSLGQRMRRIVHDYRTNAQTKNDDSQHFIPCRKRNGTRRSPKSARQSIHRFGLIESLSGLKARLQLANIAVGSTRLCLFNVTRTNNKINAVGCCASIHPTCGYVSPLYCSLGSSAKRTRRLQQAHLSWRKSHDPPSVPRAAKCEAKR